jgi:biopolymer transport protein ExbD
MARTFRRRQTAQPISELNVTNLIDLGFTLLIIFMIATPLINQEQTIPLKLPTESKSVQMRIDADTKFHSVSIKANGQYYLDEKAGALSMAELKTQLRAFAAEKKKPVIRIRGDEAVPYGKIIQLIDELKKMDLLSVHFDTQAPN